MKPDSLDHCGETAVVVHGDEHSPKTQVVMQGSKVLIDVVVGSTVVVAATLTANAVAMRPSTEANCMVREVIDEDWLLPLDVEVIGRIMLVFYRPAELLGGLCWPAQKWTLYGASQAESSVW